VKENDKEELSNSMMLNVITSSFFSDFPKIIPRGVAKFFQFRVALNAFRFIIYRNYKLLKASIFLAHIVLLTAYYMVSQKTVSIKTTIHLFITLTNVGRLLKILSLSYSPQNLQQNPRHISHYTLKMSLHYAVKHKMCRVFFLTHCTVVPDMSRTEKSRVK